MSSKRKNPDFSLIGFPLQNIEKPKTLGREVSEFFRDFLGAYSEVGEAERQKREATANDSASNGVLKFPRTKQEALLQKIESVVELKPFGKATFKAIGHVLTLERKAYIKQDIAPDIAPLKKRKLKAGNLARPETIKGYEMLQKSLANGDKPEWDEIARECLIQPGKRLDTTSWPDRVMRFRKAVFALKSRLKKETRLRGK